MIGNFVQDLESRCLFSASLAAHPAALPAAGPAIHARVALPKLAARYVGSVSIPSIGHFKSTVLTISKQLANGSFTGKFNAAGSIISASGVVKANKTFTITLKGSHVGGAINGTGTGKINANGSLTISMKFTNSGQVFPGTISLAKR